MIVTVQLSGKHDGNTYLGNALYISRDSLNTGWTDLVLVDAVVAL